MEQYKEQQQNLPGNNETTESLSEMGTRPRAIVMSERLRRGLAVVGVGLTMAGLFAGLKRLPPSVLHDPCTPLNKVEMVGGNRSSRFAAGTIATPTTFGDIVKLVFQERDISVARKKVRELGIIRIKDVEIDAIARYKDGTGRLWFGAYECTVPKEQLRKLGKVKTGTQYADDHKWYELWKTKAYACFYDMDIRIIDIKSDWLYEGRVLKMQLEDIPNPEGKKGELSGCGCDSCSEARAMSHGMGAMPL